MGIFDFFKKKEKKVSVEQAEEVGITATTKAHLDETAPPLAQEETVEVPVQHPLPNEEDNSTTVKTISIEITADDQGSHGDNFGGLLGFSTFRSEEGRAWINEKVGVAYDQKPSLEEEEMKITEVSLDENQHIKMRTIIFKEGPYKGEILSPFPYVETSYILPFETKRIVEWSHSEYKEAEIEGGGRATFGLSFYATDYAVNKEKYQTEKKLNIRISAVALVLDTSDFTEVNGVPLSPDFCTYMPNNDLSTSAYFDFIGVLNDFKPCKIQEGNEGYLLNVKLINQEEDPDFFTIDMFINKENMRFDTLTKGMKITGAFWLQGEIASLGDER